MESPRSVELRQLIALLEVVDTGTYRAAGESLHLSEPAVWKQVAALQDELGVEVLRRTGRQTQLTPNGELVVAAARAAVAAADQITGLARALADGDEGVVRVACVRPHIVACLAAAVGRTRRRRPNVRVELVDYANLGMSPAEALDRGVVDVATVTPLPASCEGHLAYEVTIAVVGRAARRRGPWVDVADLVDRPLVLSPRGFYSRDRLEASFAAMGADVHVAFESSSSDVLIAMADAGLGTAVVASDSVGPTVPAVPVAAEGVVLRDEIWAAWAHDLSPSAAALVDAIVSP